MKKLKDIIDTDLDIKISGITDDSRKVKKDYLFVATNGYNVDHYDYIDDAIKNGCSFIVCNREIENNFPYLVVDNINDYYIFLCKKYYDVDTDNFKLIGITGTDGKTTTTTIIKNLIDDSAYMGTNGLDVSDKSYDTSNTTPCVEELYHNFKIIKDSGCNTVSMEVSSEALLHDRVKDLKFDIVGFTNITGDHLNVHKTFDNYVACKMKLLDLVKDDGYVVVNGDDDILKTISHTNKVMIGFEDYNDCIITNVIYGDDTIIDLVYQNKNYTIRSPLLGKYNVYNVVMAFIIGLLSGVNEDLLIDRIGALKPISGRCEDLDFGQNYKIILDYAHTINGIKSILETFKDYDIITVTGCAGGREHEKRRTIGKLVMDNSFISIFTMDDPRYEDVHSIIDEMVENDKDYFRIVDREDAICYALNIAHPGSCVLILGKGRDNYMAIENKKISYSDYDVISNYFREN